MAKSISLLWGAGSPPCWRVMITLEEKKLQGYKHKLLSFEKGDHKSQEVLEINPRGQVGCAEARAGRESLCLDTDYFSNTLVIA